MKPEWADQFYQKTASFPSGERGLKLYVDIVPTKISLSFPSGERGLKLLQESITVSRTVSFPSEERGLKRRGCSLVSCRRGSFPSWERGLKHCREYYGYGSKQSFPSWERGLKQQWTRPADQMHSVVPLVGTWIETCPPLNLPLRANRSFPSWERGLKPSPCTDIPGSLQSFPSWECGLKLVGSVPARVYNLVVPLVGTWIETSQNLSS